MSEVKEKRTSRTTVTTPDNSSSKKKRKGDPDTRKIRKKGTEQEEKETTQQQEESKQKQDDEEASGHLNIQSNLTDEDKILVDKDTKKLQDQGKTPSVPDDEKDDNSDSGQQTHVTDSENTGTDDVINEDSQVTNSENTRSDDAIKENSQVTNPENTRTDDVNKEDSQVNPKTTRTDGGNNADSIIENNERSGVREDTVVEAKSEDDIEKSTGENTIKQEKEEKQEQPAFITEQSNETSLAQEKSSPVEKKEQIVDDKRDDQLHAEKSDDTTEPHSDMSSSSQSSHNHDKPEMHQGKSQSTVNEEEIQRKETEPSDIVHADHHDDVNYGTKYDEEGTMEIDDEVVHHETRDRKYSSASSSSQSSKSSTKSNIKENEHETHDAEKDQTRKSNTDDIVIRIEPKEKPDQTRKESEADSQTTDKKATNVHYDVKINNDRSSDKPSATTINSPTQQKNNASNKHAHRVTTQSAQFRRPVHTSDSPREKPGPFLRRRPKTTDTRILPSRAAEKQRKNYFHEELRRLKTRLDTEAKSEKRPEEREYYPYTFTTMGPYCDTHTAEFLICMPDEDLQPQRPISRGRSDDKSHGYVSRNTAIGLCDPWVDLQMDREILPRLVPPKQKEKGKDGQKKKPKEKKTKEGSTRLPKFPVVPFNTNKENATKMFPYSDVKKFREEYREKYSTYAQKRVEQDYKKTKQDFYRMDLDRLDEIHPLNRRHMRKTYFAYLQNTPGSKKAVTECVKELYPESSEEKPGSAPPPAVPSPQQTAQEAN